MLGSVRLIFSPLVLLVTSVVVCLPAVSSSGSDVACRGAQATLVGSPGVVVVGTEGADVVVTNGAAHVEVLGGDDLVCVTGESDDTAQGTGVLAGPGNDVIDATAGPSSGVYAMLGIGDDEYVGGDGPDRVGASQRFTNGMPPGNSGRDVVSTGGGADYVSTGGGPEHPDSDVIDLGRGGDEVLVVGATSPDTELRGDSGRDLITFETLKPGGAWLLDNSAGRASIDGAPALRWEGFERFDVISGFTSTVMFVGGGGSEFVRSIDVPVSAKLGAGDDTVLFEAGRRVRDQRMRLDGGSGVDRIRLWRSVGVSAIDLDLAAGTLRMGIPEPDGARTAVTNFEVADVLAHFVRLVGTAGANSFRYGACVGSISGGDGPDTIAYHQLGDEEFGCGYSGGGAIIPVRGGRGDDELIGGSMNDRLLGGEGEDFADGRARADFCRAEHTARCELG